MVGGFGGTLVRSRCGEADCGGTLVGGRRGTSVEGCSRDESRGTLVGGSDKSSLRACGGVGNCESSQGN